MLHFTHIKHLVFFVQKSQEHVGIGGMHWHWCDATHWWGRLMASRGWFVRSGFENFEVIASVRRGSNFSLWVATRAT